MLASCGLQPVTILPAAPAARAANPCASRYGIRSKKRLWQLAPARSWLGLGIVVLLSTVLGAPARSLSVEPEGAWRLPENPLVGKVIFVEKGCVKCHAVHGEGGSVGPDLGRVGVWRSVMELIGDFWNHSPGMIAKMRERDIRRPIISTDEMVDLAAFLYSLNYFDSPGDVLIGEWLFSEKGCFHCHSVGGQGGHAGPPLDGYKGFSSPLPLARAMWSHNAVVAGSTAENDIPRPEFGDRDLAHIFAYIQNASTDGSGKRTAIAPGSPARGEKLFQQKSCGRCHAVRGSGGQVGPDLGEAELHRSVTEIAALMWNHVPAMSAKMQALGISVPQFGDQEFSDLMAYLFFLQYFDPPGDPVKGQELYVEKSCNLCHSAPPSGGKRLAPDLSRSPALSSPLALASAMWNHVPLLEKQVRERGQPWPLFKEGEVRDLVEYLRSPRSAQAAGGAKGSWLPEGAQEGTTR